MKRLVFDFILLALYILVMNFNFTRHTGHEVLGCIFSAEQFLWNWQEI